MGVRAPTGAPLALLLWLWEGGGLEVLRLTISQFSLDQRYFVPPKYGREGTEGTTHRDRATDMGTHHPSASTNPSLVRFYFKHHSR